MEIIQLQALFRKPVCFNTHEISRLSFFTQTDLEMVTEDLAQKVNRPYLRTPRHKIIRAACLVQQKRQEFLASVARGVAPNDSPEAPRRRWLTDMKLSLFSCFFFSFLFFFISFLSNTNIYLQSIVKYSGGNNEFSMQCQLLVSPELTVSLCFVTVLLVEHGTGNI